VSIVEPLLLTTVRISTYNQQKLLTNATGFFFARDKRLFLVTSRHVMHDKPSEHFPDRLVIEIHVDPDNMAYATDYSIPLYRNGMSLWRQAVDTAGEVDVAAIEIDRDRLPGTDTYKAFTVNHLLGPHEQIEVGTTLLIVGYPLGFHDNLHHMPIVRHAIVASSFGLRFQGEGFFLTDARTHRGISGAPVVTPVSVHDPGMGDLPWRLLGIHSARLDVGTRDLQLDEVLGLNCSWYSDILLTLTEN
jgi:hypothetical protein